MERRDFIKLSLSAFAIAALPPKFLEQSKSLREILIEAFPKLAERVYVGLLDPYYKELQVERQPVAFDITNDDLFYTNELLSFDLMEACTIAYIALYEYIDSSEYILSGKISLDPSPDVMAGQEVRVDTMRLRFA